METSEQEITTPELIFIWDVSMIAGLSVSEVHLILYDPVDIRTYELRSALHTRSCFGDVECALLVWAGRTIKFKEYLLLYYSSSNRMDFYNEVMNNGNIVH